MASYREDVWDRMKLLADMHRSPHIGEYIHSLGDDVLRVIEILLANVGDETIVAWADDDSRFSQHRT